MTISFVLLRPALEAAMKVARDGEAADPVTPAPPLLRRYLSFARLPGPALEVARRVVDDDPEFRRRVAERTSPEEVGEAAWVWLKRPAGWKAQLDALCRQAQEVDRAARDDKAERSARRRLAGAEAAARRAEVVLDNRTRERDEALKSLAAEQAGRHKAEGELAIAVQDALTGRDERNAAVRALKRVEADLAAQAGDLRHARHQVRMLEAELAQAAGTASTPSSASSSASSASSGGLGPGSSGPPGLAIANGQAAIGAAELELLTAAVTEASDASRRLGDALGRAGTVLGASRPAAARSADTVEDPRPDGGLRGSTTPRPSRAPLALPPGLLDDAPAAAAHLCRAPGVVVLVDGYNVSQRAWPDQPIGEQRARLVDALRELHARSGADVEVVFDGAHPGTPPSSRAGRRAGGRDPVRVRFSPPGVEADEVVLELVASVPAMRPVVVASSDRYVRDGARRLGANVVGSVQLLAALRR